MAKAKPATQKGLNQQMPKRLADTLARKLRGMATRTKAILLTQVVPAIEAGDAEAVRLALEEIDAFLAANYSTTQLRDAAAPIAAQANSGHANKFFAGLGALLGWKILGTDLPSDQFREVQAVPRSTGTGGPVIVTPKVNVAPVTNIAAFVTGIELFVGKLRNGITDGIEDEIDRERSRIEAEPEEEGISNQVKLAAVLAAVWAAKGSPSNIGFDRETEVGGPVLVRVRSHIDMIVLDQMSDLNADLNHDRMGAAAIDSFVWETRKDSRVRPAHIALQGTIHTWQGGANGVFPGQPVNCRCWPRAVVDSDKVKDQGAFTLVASPDIPAPIRAPEPAPIVAPAATEPVSLTQTFRGPEGPQRPKRPIRKPKPKPKPKFSPTPRLEVPKAIPTKNAFTRTSATERLSQSKKISVTNKQISSALGSDEADRFKHAIGVYGETAGSNALRMVAGAKTGVTPTTKKLLLQHVGGEREAKKLLGIIDNGLEKLPKFKGEIFRGLNLSKEGFASFSKQIESGVVSDAALTSWTADGGMASVFGDDPLGLNTRVILRKPNKQGVSIGRLTSRAEEVEVLHPKARHKILGTKEEILPDGRKALIIDLE